MKDLLDNSSINKGKKRVIITDINNINDDDIISKSYKEQKNSEFSLGSDYFNIKEENKSKNEKEDESVFLSITSDEDDFNFYNVEKAKIINYMTPIKVNKAKNNKKKLKSKEKNKTNKEITEEMFSTSGNNNSDKDKKIMISELDIELANSKNSQKNFSTNYKTEINSMKLTKKKQSDFKKQIEQNLKKFLELNKENKKLYNAKKSYNIKNKEIARDKLILKKKMRIKKNSQNFKYYFTGLNKYKKNNTSNKNTINAININKNPNKLSSIITMKKNNNKLNKNSFKTKTQNATKHNFHKKFNAFVNINLPIKPKKNTDKKKDFKNSIFYLQNKKLNYKMIKPNELSDYIIYHKNSHNNNYNSYNYKKIRNEFINISENKRILDNQEKNNYAYNSTVKSDNSNNNGKNIIIQNFNCIDYNSINISINNNNTLLKKHKLSHRRNFDKNNSSNNNTINQNYNTINNNINNNKIFNKKEKPKKIEFFYKSYIKNFYKNINNYTSDRNYITFLSKNNEKKLTFIENNSDIKNKILNCYLNNKENQNLNSLNNKNTIQKKIPNKLTLNFKRNDPQIKRYFNTMENNSFAVSKKNTIKKK